MLDKDYVKAIRKAVEGVNIDSSFDPLNRDYLRTIVDLLAIISRLQERIDILESRNTGGSEPWVNTVKSSPKVYIHSGRPITVRWADVVEGEYDE